MLTIEHRPSAHNRYSTLAAVGAAIAFVYGNPPSCRAAAYAVGVLFWIMNTGVQGIFYLRTCAICEWRMSMRIGLLVAALMTSGCWFASIWAYKGSDNVPNLPYGGKCFYSQEISRYRGEYRVRFSASGKGRSII